MTRYRPGEVLLLEFPFPAQRATKRRPVVVLSDVDAEDLLVAQVTSHAPRGQFDVPIKSWRSAGLLYPSCVRVDKMAALPREDVRKSLGSPAADDRRAVSAAIGLLFANLR